MRKFLGSVWLAIVGLLAGFLIRLTGTTRQAYEDREAFHVAE